VGEIEFAISYFRANRMSFYTFSLKYAIKGSLNYIYWNKRMEEILEGTKLKEFIDKDIPKPAKAQDLAEWRKCVAKMRRFILKGVRDHNVSNVKRFHL